MQQRNGNTEIVNLLLSKGADVNARDNDNMNSTILGSTRESYRDR